MWYELSHLQLIQSETQLCSGDVGVFSGVYFIMNREILTEISKKYWLLLLMAQHGFGQAASSPGELNQQFSGRRSHLHGIVHLCNSFLETASWSKLKFRGNKYPLEITNNLSTLVELIVKKKSVKSSDWFYWCLEPTRTLQPLLSVNNSCPTSEKPNRTNPRCVNICFKSLTAHLLGKTIIKSFGGRSSYIKMNVAMQQVLKKEPQDLSLN